MVARSETGFVAFDGQYVTVGYLGGLARTVMGKGITRFPITSVTSIELSKVSLMGSPGAIIFSVAGAGRLKQLPGKITMGFGPSRQPSFLELHHAIEQAQRARLAPQQAAPTQSASSGILEQLEKLGSLREAGILTDEEFAAKKRTLLDRL